MIRPMPTPQRARAYTLIEVIIVIAILGLVSAIVVPQMLSAGTMGVQAATRIIVADLIFAQNDAMARQTSRRVVFDAVNDSYKLTDNAGVTLDASWLSGQVQNYMVSFRDDDRFQGVDILSVNFGGDGTITFDDMGAPDTGGTIELEYKKHRYRISVAEFTGRITVTKITGGGG